MEDTVTNSSFCTSAATSRAAEGEDDVSQIGVNECIGTSPTEQTEEERLMWAEGGMDESNVALLMEEDERATLRFDGLKTAEFSLEFESSEME